MSKIEVIEKLYDELLARKLCAQDDAEIEVLHNVCTHLLELHDKLSGRGKK